MRSTPFYFVGLLVLAGAGWGVTQPLSKIAVTAGYKHFYLVFCQMALGAVMLGGLTLLRGKGFPMDRRSLGIYAMIAIIGTLVPNTASYQAVAHLPSGLMSVLLSLIPMVAFPVAMLLGLDQFSMRRLAGLSLGMVAVLIIVGPEAALPDPAMVAWVPVALIAPLCYAFEGNLVAKIGLGKLDPIQALAGASILGTFVALPLALGTGQWVNPIGAWTAAKTAIVLSAALHAAVYATYVWLVSQAGPTFSAQVSYLVTGFGVVWAMILLGERYSPFVWAALVLMFLGLFLVQPRRKPVQAERLQAAAP